MFFKNKQEKQERESITAEQAREISDYRKAQIIEKEINDCLQKIKREAENGKYRADISRYCSYEEVVEYLESLGYTIKPNLIDCSSPIAYWAEKE